MRVIGVGWFGITWVWACAYGGVVLAATLATKRG